MMGRLVHINASTGPSRHLVVEFPTPGRRQRRLCASKPWTPAALCGGLAALSGYAALTNLAMKSLTGRAASAA